MATIVDPSLVSNPEELKWVAEIDEILNYQLSLKIENPSISFFEVPETITTKKPEAYEPQQIGLGPIHHFQPKVYKRSEQKKLFVMQKVLQNQEIKDYQLVVHASVRKVLPIIRSCYDMFLQASDDTLARVFAIDGVFLLNLFHTCNSQMPETNSSESVVYVNRPIKLLPAVLDEEIAIVEADQTITSDVVHSGNSASDGFRSLTLIPKVVNESATEERSNLSTHDSVYLLHGEPELPNVDPKRRLIAQDVMMLENQIPFMVLKEIGEALHPSSRNSSYSINKYSVSPSSIYRTFCEIHSPLELCSKSRAPTTADHLLHYMYDSVVNNVSEKQYQHILPSITSTDPFLRRSDCANQIDLVSNAYNFVTKIPQKEIVQAYEQTVLVLETFSQSNILTPSASRLHEKAGCRFCSLDKYQGIQNIRIYWKDIYLPCVTLNTDSEVILRNLVAYETLITKSGDFPLTEYVALMCALIVEVEDVKLLKKQNVIRGDLGDAEVAKLFIGLSTSMPAMKGNGKSKLQEVIDHINKVYERGLRVKMYLLLKKVARWLLVVLKAIGSFVESSWKIVAFMVSIVTVFCLMWQAYCETFSCDKTTVTFLPYSSS